MSDDSGADPAPAKDMPASDTPVTDAVETLMKQLEHEHAWAAELRADLDHTEKNCTRLKASVAMAAEMLPPDARRGYKLRLARLVVGRNALGRPPKDKRQAVLLEYLAARVEETVSNADIRRHLDQQGIENNPQYISTRLAAWAVEGMLTRLSHGLYKVNSGDMRLLAVTERPSDPDIRATIEKEKAERFAGRSSA